MSMNHKKNIGYEFIISSLLVLVFFLPVSALASDIPANNKQISARIIGGTASKVNAWPWMAALLVRNVSDNFLAQYCGGALIHSQWVVTSAHCMYENGILTTTADTIDILVGTNDLNHGGQRIQVDTIHIHPDFNPANLNLENDIALLHLSSPAEGITPLSLPGRSFDLPVVQENAIGTVMGWGTITTSGDGFYPILLRQVDLPVLSNSDCRNYLGLINNDINITSNHLCAGFIEGGKDSCLGDSGGPFISSISGEDKLVGIVSWGYGCAEPGAPGVYARVSKYEDFINDHICLNEKPATPSLSVANSINVNGENVVTVSFSEVSGADEYRLYYAPYVATGDILQIAHIETGRTISFILPLNPKYYIAGQAVKGNCVSGFSDIGIAP